MSDAGQKYTKKSPYTSRVLNNYQLTAEGSEKETRHIELALEEGMTYTPGDAVGIIPEYRTELVETTLKTLGFTGTESVADNDGVPISLEEALRRRLNIGKLARGAVNQLAKLAETQGSVPEKLKEMLGADGRARSEEYCWGREFLDLVHDFPGIITEPQQIFNILQRLTPRMYSISSSLAAHPNEVHTTVRVIKYESHGREREGVASAQMGNRAPVDSTLPIFLEVNPRFRMPENPDAPIIMIGPGTGVAPFRAFMEEREVRGEKGKMWLIFGEQRRALDYLYEKEVTERVEKGVLTKLSTAFSRDQGKKVYVQDRMAEEAAELYKWLEEGAYFYVCGDASRMAKDVELALLDAIAQGSNGTLEHAKEYLDGMKKQKRYQRDVY